MGAGRWKSTSMMTIGHEDMIKIGTRRFACQAKDYVTQDRQAAWSQGEVGSVG